MSVRTLKELEYVDHTDTILIGPVIASADTEHGRLSIVAGGGTVRFLLDGVDGYVDLDLQNFAAAAVAWLGAKKDIERAEISEAISPTG